MYLIIGLGNVGEQYIQTRHNIGFMLLDYILDGLHVVNQGMNSLYAYVFVRLYGNQVGFIKPQKMMNRSGKPVYHAIKELKSTSQKCMICYDDVALPLGKIRIRARGGSAGHNGMLDIIETMATDNIPRLRMGIGGNYEYGRQSNYVLSPFEKKEYILKNNMMDRAKDAIYCFIQNNVEKTMSLFNTDVKK